MRVIFTPQAWMRDYAVEVDAEGETTWTVSAEGMAALATYQDRDDAIAYEPWFQADPNCPEWIRDWHGPFYIRVIDEEEA